VESVDALDLSVAVVREVYSKRAAESMTAAARRNQPSS